MRRDMTLRKMRKILPRPKTPEDSTQEEDASTPKTETAEPSSAKGAKKTRKVQFVFSGPERPPLMKEGDPTTYYLQGKVNRNSTLHYFL